MLPPSLLQKLRASLGFEEGECNAGTGEVLQCTAHSAGSAYELGDVAVVLYSKHIRRN
jgi:hypothetical protein